MTTKRRMVIEVAEAGWDQTTIDYDVQHDIEGCYGARTKAIQSFVWGSYGSLTFAPIEGEKSYEGWSRCTINVSGPMCIKDEGGFGGACLAALDPKNEEEMATQLCWDCRNSEEE